MNSKIGKNVRIGTNVTIGNFSEIIGKVIIEDNVRISSFVSIGSPPEHRKFNMDVTLKSIVIKKNTIIREHVTINNGISVDTQIGENCYIMNKSHIGHDAIIGNNVTISPSVNVGGHSVIGEHANLGMGSVLHQYCDVEAATMIGANAFVKGKCEKGLIYAGVPARPISINHQGLEKSGLGKEEIRKIVSFYEKKFNF